MRVAKTWPILQLQLIGTIGRDHLTDSSNSVLQNIIETIAIRLFKWRSLNNLESHFTFG